MSDTKATEAMRAFVELAQMGVPVRIGGLGDVTIGYGEDGTHIHLGRYDDQGFSVPLTAESLAETILEIRSTAVSKWSPMTDADEQELDGYCWARSEDKNSWCGLLKGHEGKHGCQ